MLTEEPRKITKEIYCAIGQFHLGLSEIADGGKKGIRRLQGSADALRNVAIWIDDFADKLKN